VGEPDKTVLAKCYSRVRSLPGLALGGGAGNKALAQKGDTPAIKTEPQRAQRMEILQELLVEGGSSRA
jgi:hypothetical protein